MKTSLKLFWVTVCIILLFVACEKKNEPKKEPNGCGGCIIPCYISSMDSTTNHYVQVGDSTYNFHSVGGKYCGDCFVLHLSSSVPPYNVITFLIFTEKIEPEIFFQKGILEINSVSINSSIEMAWTFENICSVFTWDTVFYENKEFKGKGSFEIKKALYAPSTYFPSDNVYYPSKDIYYPPQKIEFEFK